MGTELEDVKNKEEKARQRLANDLNELVAKHKGLPNALPNAMVINESTRKRTFRYVPDEDIPSSSFAKDYSDNRGGFWVHTIRWIIGKKSKQYDRLHILGLDLENNYWAIVSPSAEEGKGPADLYMAKHCADEVDDVYGLSMPVTEKIKIGILIFLCFAIMIVLFLIAAASGGT